MNNLSTLLEYLDEDMNEAAKSVREAISEKLAAYTNNNFIILYNPKAALNNINDNISYQYSSVEEIISFEGAIVGYVSYKPNDYCGDNTYEVKTSAALSGYGPLLYDLVLSHIYPNFLTSDRNSVSSQAQKVWNFYLNNRPDVNKHLITSIYDTNLDSNCGMPEEMFKRYPKLYKLVVGARRLGIELDDAIQQNEKRQTIAKLKAELKQANIEAQQYLSTISTAHRYQIKSPKGLTALKNNHIRCLQSIKSIIPKQLIDKNHNIKNITEDILEQEAETFFGEMYY